MKVFLIGMMGVGKTLYSGKWAKVINATAYDLDDMIIEQERMSITEIFAQKGEDYFRKKEAELLRSFADKDNFILATGGGVPCFYDNMQWMNENGITIWLNELPDILYGRLKHAKAHRPLLKDLDDEALRAYLDKKMTEREPYYSQAKYIFTGKEIATQKFKDVINENYGK